MVVKPRVALACGMGGVVAVCCQLRLGKGSVSGSGVGGGAPFRLEDSSHVAGVQSARSLACSLDGGWRLKGVPEDIQGL
jgi:hypothetical protein